MRTFYLSVNAMKKSPIENKCMYRLFTDCLNLRSDVKKLTIPQNTFFSKKTRKLVFTVFKIKIKYETIYKLMKYLTNMYIIIYYKL